MQNAATAHPAPPTTRRRVLLLAGLLVALATAALAADVARQRATAELVVWATPVALSHPADRPTLLRFTADWCPPCQTMKHTVFSRSDIAHTLSTRFRAVSADLTQPGTATQNLATRYKVLSIPTFVVLNPEGHETTRLVGAADHKRFAAFLAPHATP